MRDLQLAGGKEKMSSIYFKKIPQIDIPMCPLWVLGALNCLEVPIIGEKTTGTYYAVNAAVLVAVLRSCGSFQAADWWQAYYRTEDAGKINLLFQKEDCEYCP